MTFLTNTNQTNEQADCQQQNSLIVAACQQQVYSDFILWSQFSSGKHCGLTFHNITSVTRSRLQVRSCTCRDVTVRLSPHDVFAKHFHDDDIKHDIYVKLGKKVAIESLSNFVYSVFCLFFHQIN